MTAATNGKSRMAAWRQQARADRLKSVMVWVPADRQADIVLLAVVMRLQGRALQPHDCALFDQLPTDPEISGLRGTIDALVGSVELLRRFAALEGKASSAAVAAVPPNEGTRVAPNVSEPAPEEPPHAREEFTDPVVEAASFSSAGGERV
jgi:hypothetical protein